MKWLLSRTRLFTTRLVVKNSYFQIVTCIMLCLKWSHILVSATLVSVFDVWLDQLSWYDPREVIKHRWWTTKRSQRKYQEKESSSLPPDGGLQDPWHSEVWRWYCQSWHHEIHSKNNDQSTTVLNLCLVSSLVKVFGRQEYQVKYYMGMVTMIVWTQVFVQDSWGSQTILRESKEIHS